MNFGEYGLQALTCGFVTARQIEAARTAISRHIKRGGKLYVRIFPDKPISKKPAETRMGKGKGTPGRVGRRGASRPCDLRARGRERGNWPRQAFHLAEHKLAVRTRVIGREQVL